MQRSFFTLALAAAMLPGVLPRFARAQDTHDTKDYPTAYTALRVVGKTLGADAINRVVEVTGRDGKPQPVSWRIVLKEEQWSREVEVVNGKIEAQRPLSQATASAPVKLQDLNLDSSGAFDATDAQARKTRVRFDSVNYTLRTSDKSGKPVWTLEAFNQTGAPAGTMRIAASNGTIVSMDGLLAAESAAHPTKTTTEEKKPAKSATASTRAASTPKATPTVAVVAERVSTRREIVKTDPSVTTNTTVQTIQPVAVIDVPDAAPTGPGTPVPTDEGGGFFTRTGRTLDHTSHQVTRSLDRAGHDVDHTLRRAGAKVQRFFTGRSDLDKNSQPVVPDDNQPD